MATSSRTAPSISDLYADCIQALGTFVKALSKDDCRIVYLGQVRISELLDEYGRAKIWGDETKADLPARARGSLDDTLRHNDDLKKLVRGILLRLKAILEQAIPIAERKFDPTAGSDQDSISSVSADSASDSGWSSDSTSDIDPNCNTKDKTERRTMPKICLLVQQIQSQIRSLYDLSSLLRRPTIADKYIHSTDSRLKTTTRTASDTLSLHVGFGIADENHIAEKMLQWRGLTKNTQDIMVENEPSALMPEGTAPDLIDDTPWLCRRLAHANTRRREQLQYWKDHPYETKRDPAYSNYDLLSLLRFDASKADEKQESQSQVSTVKPNDANIPLKGPKSTATKQTGTSKQSFSTVALSDIHDTKTNTRPRTVYAPTAIGQFRSNSVPDPPKPEEGAATFLCPYCGMALEYSEMKNRQSWKRHVFRDLRPYVCTFEECSNAGKLYVSRHDWTYHELQVHRRQYVCQELHCGSTFTSRGEMSTHLQSHHVGSISTALLSIMVDLCDRQMDISEIKEEPCIFCGDSQLLSRLQTHLAAHMEDLALFVLPSTSEDETEGSNASIQAAKIGSRGKSIGSESEASSLGFSEPMGNENDPVMFEKLATTEQTGYDSKFSLWNMTEERQVPASEPPMNEHSRDSHQDDQESDMEIEEEDDESNHDDEGIGNTAEDENFLWGSLEGHKYTVQQLLEKKMHLNAEGFNGETPLVSAVKSGRTADVSLLVSNGAQIDLPDAQKDRTPLSWASYCGHEELVKLFLNTDPININSEDNLGRTALSFASESGHEDIVRILLNVSEINPDQPDIHGRTPLSWASANGHGTVVKLLLYTDKVNPDSRGQAGRTPLSWASENGHDTVVKLLLESEKVHPDEADVHGRTPLSWASANGHGTIVKLLLDTNKVNPDSEGSAGRTPLSWASGKGHGTVVKLLLETGRVRPDHADIHGRTPLSRASENGHDTVVKLLLESGKVNPDSKGNAGRTPLSWASGNGHEKVVKLLLDTKNVDAKKKDMNGRSPIDWAIENVHLPILLLLMKVEKMDIDFHAEWFLELLWKYAELGKTVSNLFDDIDSGDSLVKFRGPRITVGTSGWSVIFNPSESRTFDVELIHTFACGRLIFCVQFSRDGQRLAFGAMKSTHIYDLVTGKRLCVLQDRSLNIDGDNYVHGVCFSRHDQYLVTGSQDSLVRVWDISSATIRQTLRGHTDAVYSVDVSSDNSMIASASGDKTVRLWNMHSGECIQIITTKDGLCSVAISPNCEYVASAGFGKSINIHDRRGSLLLEYANEACYHRDSIYSVRWSPDGNTLVTASLDKTLKMLDVSNLGKGPVPDQDISKSITAFGEHADYALSAVYTPDANWLVSSSRDGIVRCWDSHTGHPQYILKGHNSSILQVAVSPAGDFFATAGGDERARVWSMRKEKLK